LNGKQFIESVIVGYEMIIQTGTCFLGRAYFDGWHPTSTCGVFGAAASASKALGLTAEETATAYGLAGSMSGGTLEYHFKGSFAKRLHPGNAARNGILAAMMAKEGFTGPWSIFEGDWGWLKTHCEKVAELSQEMKPVVRNVYDASLLCDELGKRYDLMTNSFKVHCGGRFGATSIDAALEIVKKHHIKAEQVKEIRVGACEFTTRAHFFEGCRSPQNMVTAQFSLPFALALVLLHQKVGLRYFRQELYKDKKIIEIMDRVVNYIDPEAEAVYPQHYKAAVTMVLRDGTSLNASVDYPKGDPENRPTPKELHDKFRDLAGMALAEQKVEPLLRALTQLDTVKKIGKLTALAVA
jgi:2-methylcitrate dehydratase PrpD